MKNDFKTRIYLAKTDCLENKELFNKLCSSVSEQRKEKIDKLRFENDKRLSLSVELLLKKALSDLNISYDDAEIAYDEYSKPYIKNSDIYFNLSHSGNMAACAVSMSEVGIDVEQTGRADFNIIKRIFTEEEQRQILSLSDEEQRKREFIRLWTLKESYSKLCKKGLSLPFSEIEIKFENNRAYLNGCSFFEMALDGYMIACCSHFAKFEEKIITIDLRLL